MVVKQSHEIISFKPSKWLEKYLFFETLKKRQAVNDFDKDFHKLLKTHSMEKQWKMFVIEQK